MFQPMAVWQRRLGSVAIDEDHRAHAVRYVSLYPVRARLVAQAQDWPWSSVRAHRSGRSDGITDFQPMMERFPDFANLVAMPEHEAATNALRQAETSGRPLGPAALCGTSREAHRPHPEFAQAGTSTRDSSAPVTKGLRRTRRMAAPQAARPATETMEAGHHYLS